MMTIEVDFEVWKTLTSLRQRQEESYNDVLRRLLKLGYSPASSTAGGGSEPEDDRTAWVVKGVVFPVGTEFRFQYKGRMYRGAVREGMLQLEDGQRFA